jgi:hypothetical protein
VDFMVGESYQGWRRREVVSEVDGPRRSAGVGGGCCGLGDSYMMWWRGGVERREVAIKGRHMRATESQKESRGMMTSGTGASRRDEAR